MLLAVFDSSALSYGSSKLFQVVLPLGAIIIFRELLPFRQTLIRRVTEFFKPNRSLEDYQALVVEYNEALDRTVGFMTWKIGCDLGFFIVSSGVGGWDRAFTWAGLIPYTVLQYILYYYVGQRMIMEGHLNPFRKTSTQPKIQSRPSLWKQFVSKYFHESTNTTSYNVSMRQVFLKPLVDYGGIVVSWSFYTIGILFLQSGEINFAAVSHFFFLNMLAFYSVNTFGFILGFNFGELFYLKLIEVWEYVDRWIRQRTQVPVKVGAINTPGSVSPQVQSQPSQSWLAQWDRRWKETRYGVFWKTQAFLDSYGLNWRWLISSMAGVLCVVIIEPKFASTVFAISDQIKELWFESMGQVDPVHLQQILHSSTLEPPPAEELIELFPETWNQLFFPEG